MTEWETEWETSSLNENPNDLVIGNVNNRQI